MGRLYGYIRTSRHQRIGQLSYDPESQQRQLLAAGVESRAIHRDVGVSGSTGTNSRAGWRLLDSRLQEGDVLVVASVDRVGRRWIDTASVLRNLRSRGVRVRSLASEEQVWMRYFDADPDSPEALIGDVLASVFTWQAQQELQSISRRTKAGLDRARAQGKKIGAPVKMTAEKLDTAQRLRRDGLNYTQIGKAIGVARGTVRRHLTEVE